MKNIQILLLLSLIPASILATTCSSDTDCAQAFEGNKCISGLCGCADLTHCTVFSYGTSCDTATKMCKCTTDTHCTGQHFGSKCLSGGKCGCVAGNYTQCSQSLLGYECINSKCGCATDFDCGRVYASSKCQTSTGTCACASSSNCGIAQNGGSCSTAAGENKGFCICTGTSDCTTNNFGPTCKDSMSLPQCGCTLDSECTGKKVGDVCVQDIGGFCGCTSDTNCAGANSYGPYCDLAGSMECTECLVNEHCTNATIGNVCDFGTRKCVKCASDSDCNGGYCDLVNRICNNGHIIKFSALVLLAVFYVLL